MLNSLMSLTRNGCNPRPWLRALLLGLALLQGATAADTTSMPSLGGMGGMSSNQLDMFKNMSPDQQQAILKQLLGGKGSGGRKLKPDHKLDFPSTSTSKSSDSNQPDDGLARLKPNDIVILEVAVLAIDEDVVLPASPEKIAEQQVAAQLQAQVQAAAQAQAPVPATTLPQSAKERLAREAMDERKKKKMLRTEDRRNALDSLRQALLAANPYKLDTDGQLHLPGIEDILLSGLTEDQATSRLLLDPSLKDLKVKLTLLPLDPQGQDALKPFGYDMFSTTPRTFTQASDVPVPPEYTLGPGDTLQLQLVGGKSGEYALVIGRDGRIMVPDVGPVAVGGLTFQQAREAVEQRIARDLAGNKVIVSMGELRSITVFVAGDSEQPGSFTVGGLSTVTNVLFASGGVKEIGSMRNIQVKRNGSTISKLDLYELLLKGDARDDLRLNSGDVVFIPPVGPTVGVTGEIRRPAIYELKGETTAADMVALSGGYTPSADPRYVTIERVNEAHERVMVDIDLTTAVGKATKLQTGDLLRLRRVPAVVANSITLTGHVQMPVSVAWHSGLRVADVIPSVEHLKQNADLHYVLVRRESSDRKVSAVSADLLKAWADRTSDANIPLSPRDQLIVFNLEGGRELILKPILDDLRRQAGLNGELSELITVGGRVKAPGQYPYEAGMTVADMIRAGGGLAEGAFKGSAELTRSEIGNGEFQQLGTVQVDLGSILSGHSASNVSVKPFDYLVIKSLPEWSEQEFVTLGGEVRFPGKYPIHRGETLSSLLTRAGGLTKYAFAEGSVFTRETLRQREVKQIADLADRMQGDLGALALQATQPTGPGAGGAASAQQALTVGNALLDGLRSLEPVGRLVININEVMASRAASHEDVVLKDGDRLVVPTAMQEVTVLGEVQSGTSHLWDPNLRRDDYIRMSGGMTRKADKSRIYIVRANGSVISGRGSRWSRSDADVIRPGDTVVVPLDTERSLALPTWTAVTTILYNIAIAATALSKF